jgi:hypothetical protein
MLEAPRWLLALVSIAFGVYHSVLGIAAWRSYDNLWIMALSMTIYLGSLVLSVVASPGLAIGRFYGALVALGGVLTVWVAHVALRPEHVDPYSTWYVGGMSALLGVLAARGQSIQAWLAAGGVITLVVLEDGLAKLGEVGIEGMLILIGAASATAFALKRADGEVLELQQAEIASESSIISSKAAAEERRTRLQNVLERVLPSLSFISANKGKLSQEQKRKLVQLEASLRDDIRGRFLLNEGVREAAASARARGVEVLILDEGGLSEVGESQLSHILDKVVSALNSVSAGKVVIRSPRGEKWLVTIMATRPGTNAPDLWLKF